MKTLWTSAAILASVLILPPATLSQSVAPTADDNLYARALSASVLEMEKEWGHINESADRQQTDYRHMVVRIDPALTEGLPTHFGDHFVEYLDDAAILRRSKTLGKSFAILTISPIKNEGNQLNIVVSLSWASARKGRLLIGISDWSTVQFGYNCDQRQFAIDSVKLGGI